MPAFIVNMGPFSWGGPRPGEFRPQGPVTFHGNLDQLFDVNPISKSKRVSVGVRIIVGFNVGGKPKWELEDLENLVREVRMAQVKIPDSTFVKQRGMYTSRKPGKKAKIVTENGAQIIIKNLPFFGTSTAKFRHQMEELAQIICERFNQEMVIVDWQENGIPVEEWLVTP